MDTVVSPVITREEREDCYRLAYRVFHQELGTMEDIADHVRREIGGEIADRATLFQARSGGDLVGTIGVLFGTASAFPKEFEQGFDIVRFAALVPRHKMSITVRFLVDPAFRNSTVPFDLIVAAARAQVARGVVLAFCDCQPHLLNLYMRLGFRPCAASFDQPGFGLMVPLMLLTSDRRHLRAVRSPLLACLENEREDPDLAARFDTALRGELGAVNTGTLDATSWTEAYALLSQSGGRVRAFEGFSEAETEAFLKQSQILTLSKRPANRARRTGHAHRLRDP